jgi:hypothetical protein
MTEKTTATKLQIKPDHAVYVTGRPDAEHLIGRLPDGALTTGKPDLADAALLFVANGAELHQRLTDTLPLLGGVQAVWICYPKGNKADINRDSIRTRVSDAGWTLVSNVSIDATWSALRAKADAT